jgi:hypothetical protein
MDDAGASVNSVVVVVNGPFRFLLDHPFAHVAP